MCEKLGYAYLFPVSPKLQSPHQQPVGWYCLLRDLWYGTCPPRSLASRQFLTDLQRMGTGDAAASLLKTGAMPRDWLSSDLVSCCCRRCLLKLLARRWHDPLQHFLHIIYAFTQHTCVADCQPGNHHCSPWQQMEM